MGECVSEEKELSRRGLLRGAVGGGVLAAGGASLAVGGDLSPGVSVAHAAERPITAPRIHARREWGARPGRRDPVISPRDPDQIVIHHTDTPNSTNYSLSHAFRLSRVIQRFHMRTRGWDDVGQHFTVSRGGHVMEGRNRTLEIIRRRIETTEAVAGPTGGLDAYTDFPVGHVVGAHTLGHNQHTLGIENEGMYATAPLPARQWDALVMLCAWLCAAYRLDPAVAIVGHRDLNKTTCPGSGFYARLPTLRWKVASLITP